MRLTPDLLKRLQKTCDTAAERFDVEDGELRKTRLRQAAAKAAQLWYEHTQTIQQLDENLEGYQDGPDLALDTPENVAGLVSTINSNKQQRKEQATEIEKQEELVISNAVDSLAQSLDAEIVRLDQLSIESIPVISRATTAQTEYTELLEERDSLSQQIDTVLQHLQVPDTSASTIALVSADLEKIDDAARHLLTANNAKEAARRQVDQARTQLGEVPEEPKDLTALRTAFETWENAKDLSVAEAEESRCASQLTTTTASLPAKWKDLIADGMPSRETIEHVVQSMSKLSIKYEAAQKTLKACTAELAEAKTELTALESAPDSVDVAAIEESRRKRDLEWQRHREHLDIETADQFEELMYVDDGNRAHYTNGAEARQRLLEAQRKVQSIEGRYKNENAIHIELSEQYEKLSECCLDLADKLGLEKQAPPSSFSLRQQDLTAAAKAVADLSNARDTLNAQDARRKSARVALTDTASLLEMDVTDRGLLVRIQSRLTMEDNQRKTWEKWQKDKRAIEKLDKELEQKQSCHEEAQGVFEQLTVALPLSDISQERIQAELPQLRRLQQLHTEQYTLSDKIDTLKQITTALTDTGMRLSKIMGSAAEECAIDPLVIIDRARERLSASRLADDKRTDAITRRDKADKQLKKLSAELESAHTQLELLFKGQEYAELEPRERASKLVERDRLRVAKTSAENERKKARDEVDQNLFTEELDRLPDATRKVELDQELQDAQETRDAARDAKNEAERLYREACEAADRSDLATEEATLLEELRNGARQAAIARLGVLAARAALRGLAKERRSDMLRDVAKAFVSMTKPAWKDVDVWSPGTGDKLVGIQNDGTAVPVANMSTGTMGQLYFALRLAGYRSFARDPGPLPMILDDIMETFDNTRARAALELCAEIGKTGQAILFTHHAHLVEMARKCIEGVAVVNIPDSGVQGQLMKDVSHKNDWRKTG